MTAACCLRSPLSAHVLASAGIEAYPAETLPVRLTFGRLADTEIVTGQRVAIPTMRLSGVADAAPQILPVCYHFDMEWINASPVPAEVIANESVRHLLPGQDLVGPARSNSRSAPATSPEADAGVTVVVDRPPVRPTGGAISGFDHLADAALEFHVTDYSTKEFNAGRQEIQMWNGDRG